MKFPHRTEAELRKYADEISEKLVERAEKSENEIERSTTLEEKEKLFNIAYAAVYAMNWHREHLDHSQTQIVMDMAEFAVQQELPYANAYQTIYIPLSEYVGQAEKEFKKENGLERW